MGTPKKWRYWERQDVFCLSDSDKHKEPLAIHVDKHITQYITALGGLIAA